ncbi:MAG: glycosyltransferase family 2 protein [Anaerolineales bacterium]|nr:glycosyltransferase family 2 protein [Anaerolineales bacterium]
MAKDGKDIWVIIPAFNEASAIGEVLSGLADYSFNIVVVDDCSTDDTFDVIGSYPVHRLRHIQNLGQGAALQTGIDYVLQNHQPDYLVTFDADGQHVPESIPHLVEVAQQGGYDVVLGSRFCDESLVENMRFSRRVLLWLAILFTNLTTGLKLTDTHNGLRLFTAEAAASIRVRQNRMAHASEILQQIARYKLRVVEAPVHVRYTAYSMAKGQTMWGGIDILIDLLKGSLK